MTLTPQSKDRSLCDLLIAAGCVTAAMIVLTWGLNLGGNLTDEVYAAICVRRYTESPLGLLSFYIGHLWSETFGFSLLNLRILCIVVQFISMAVSCTYLYCHTRNLRFSAIVFLLGCVAMRLGAANFYNWDTGAFPFEAIALWLLLAEIRKISAAGILALGCACGLVTLARTPSVFFLAAAVVILWFAIPKNFPAKRIFAVYALLTASFCITLLVFSTIILGSPFDYFRLFSQDSIISGHSPVSDIHMLFGRLAYISLLMPRTWAFGLGCLALAILFPKIKNIRICGIILLCWLAYCVFDVYCYTKFDTTTYYCLGIDTPLGLALLLALPVYALFSRKEMRVDHQVSLSLWTCAAMLVAIAFGSDGYFTRMTAAFVIPFIIPATLKKGNHAVTKFVKYLVGIALISFSAMLVVHLWLVDRYLAKAETLAIGAYNGIKTDSSVYDYVKKTEKATQYLRSKGIPYINIMNNLGTELAFGPDEGLSFQEFHHQLTESEFWFESKRDFIDRIDAVVYTDSEEYDLQPIVDDLVREGFTLRLTLGDACIMMRSDRKNPDKQYPKIK